MLYKTGPLSGDREKHWVLYTGQLWYRNWSTVTLCGVIAQKRVQANYRQHALSRKRTIQ